MSDHSKYKNGKTEAQEVKLEEIPFAVRQLSDFDRYQFCLTRDAYHGSGGFYDGSYLERGPREEQEKYNYRVANKKYNNFVKTTVNGFLDPIFYNDPVRNSNSDYYEGFQESATLGDQVTLTSYMFETGVDSIIFAGVFVVMDNFKKEEIPVSKTQAIEERIYPYLYTITPLDLQYYSFDRFGRVQYVSYKIGEDVEGKGIYRVYRYADETDILNGYQGKIGDPITYVTNEENKRNPDSVVKIYSLPYFFKMSSQYDNKVYPISAIQGISDASKNIFQINSLILYQQTQLTFPILTYCGDKDEELTLSEDSVLYFDPEAQRPDYIAPPRDTLEALYKDRDNTKLEIFEMMQQAVNQVASTASGDARKQSDKQRQEALGRMEKRFIELERWIYNGFFSMVGETPDVEITYQSNFDIDNIVEDLDEAQGMIDLGVSEETAKKVKEKVLRKYFSSMTDTEFEEVKKNEEQARTFGDQTPDEEPEVIPPEGDE